MKLPRNHEFGDLSGGLKTEKFEKNRIQVEVFQFYLIQSVESFLCYRFEFFSDLYLLLQIHS